MKRRLSRRILFFALVFTAATCFAETLPTIPLGLDAYRKWDLWPMQRLGMRAYMRSTYDRRGGNEGADASHFLFQQAEDFNVAFDIEGPGILCFARYNHWHGSPWHYVVDGRDYLVSESSTAAPLHPVAGSTFLPKSAFPAPLAWTWAETKGADLSWVPVSFNRSLRMAYSRTHYGTGYYIYQQCVDGIPVSHNLRSWNTNSVPDRAVLDLIARSGTDIAPRGHIAASGDCDLRPGVTVPIQLSNAPAIVRCIEISAPREQALKLGRARLRIFWDGRTEASIDAPVAHFFGAGTFYNRDDREYLVKAFPVNVRFTKARVYAACYFPMPFFKSARFDLVGDVSNTVPNVHYSIRTMRVSMPANQLSYFHATYRDFPKPEQGQDLVLLDTRQIEGAAQWSGHLVGTSWIFSDRANLNTLEGDPRFFFDDSLTPQAQGTGTEEWGGGGDYWGGQTMTLPFAGHPVGARNLQDAKNEEDKIESAYRFLLGDLMPFGRNAVIRLEHGGENQSTEHYQTVTYWYGLPAASLVQTDELKIAQPESERAHDYQSPDASEPYEITSRYEWGVDTLDGKEIYPAHVERGRKTTGASEFTMRLDPRNVGVLLRRKLDYQFPNQRAEVFVADVGRGKPKWQRAGIWYLAGGNTCVYSNPKGELDAAEHRVETSNRRFRDDEFLVPRRLTEGRHSIRLRIQFTPVARPLLAGHPLPQLAWSEIKYTAYCFIVPPWQL